MQSFTLFSRAIFFQSCTFHPFSNYSTGEGVEAEASEGTTGTAEDGDHFKRSLQLVVNEQRRKSRLTHRIEAMEDEKKKLKRQAARLLKLCQTMKDEAHEPDPDYVPPTLGDPKPNRRGPQPVAKVPGKFPNENKTSFYLRVSDVPIFSAVPLVPCDVCNKIVKQTW